MKKIVVSFIALAMAIMCHAMEIQFPPPMKLQKKLCKKNFSSKVVGKIVNDLASKKINVLRVAFIISATCLDETNKIELAQTLANKPEELEKLEQLLRD